jgi:lipoprotein signal peptidase
LDLWSKQRWFPIDDISIAFSYANGWIRNVRHLNEGLIANLPVPFPIILTISVLVILAILFGLYRSWSQQRQQASYAIAVLLGGALGNLWDRSALGFVRDWILIADRSAFNIADLAIFIGIVWWMFTSSRHERQPRG